MYSSSSSRQAPAPISTRRDSSSHNHRHQQAPLSTTSVSSTSSRRQQLALFRHASTRRASANSMNKTRQHAKQLAALQQQSSNGQSQQSHQTTANGSAAVVDFFADFSAAFPDPHPEAAPATDLFTAKQPLPPPEQYRSMPQQQRATSSSTSNSSSIRNNALLQRRLSRSSKIPAKMLHTNDSFASDDNGSTTNGGGSIFGEEDPFSPEAQRRAARELELQQRQQMQQQQMLAQQALQQQAQMKARAAAKLEQQQRVAEEASMRAAAATAPSSRQQQDFFQADFSQQQQQQQQRIPVASPTTSNYHRSASMPPTFFATDDGPMTPPPAARSHSMTGSSNVGHNSYPSPSSAASSKNGTAGGAAARRRMRNQMRKSSGGGSVHGSESDSAYAYSPSSSSRHSLQQTPPQSPAPTTKSAQQQQEQQRWQLQQQHQYYYNQHSDASSVGASSAGSTSKHHHAARSITGSIGSTNRSVTSSTASSSGGLFDTKHPDGGFRFDAFGLDESQINREVSAAMQEIAHQNPNLSFFVDDNDFANNSSGAWDHSPNPSRTSTPTKLDDDDEQDGFVDGFRVNKPLRQSPTSTERSSLTSDSSGRVNLFKQKAGFHESKSHKVVVRPGTALTMQPLGTTSVADLRRKQQNMSRQQPNAMQLDMPKLQGPVMQRRKAQDVDFFDSGFESSDAEGFESDVGGGTNTSTTADPTDILSSADGSTRRHEEKKDEETSMHQSMEALKSRWAQQSRVAARNRVAERQAVAAPAIVKTPEVHKQPEVQPLSASYMKQANDSKIQKSTEAPDQDVAIQQVPSYERRQCHQSLSSGRSSPVSTHEENAQLPHQPVVQFSGATSYSRTVDPMQSGPGDRELDDNPSFESLRDRLRPVSAKEAKDIKAKSEGGALNVSAVSAVLKRIEASSLNDSKSDVGTPSPAFAQVRLRQTPFAKTDEPQRKVSSPTVTLAAEVYQQEPVQCDDPVPTVRKLTYRERRELELEQQREIDERRNADAQEESADRNDVASQIRRRVASVAQQNAGLPTIPTSHVTETMLYKNLRPTRLENESIQPDSTSAFRHPVNSSRTVIAPAPALVREPSDLLIQPSTSGDLDSSPSKEADAVVSRLLKLKHTDKQAPPDAKTIESSEPSPNDKGPNQLHTPKATMMMLNAFLAGREAISSHETNSVDQPTMIEVGETDSRNADIRAAAVSPSQYPADLPALKDDPKYAKFFKMLSVGMPVEVVKHAMTRDGFNPAVMDQDHNRPVGIPLNRDVKFAKYFKMLAIGLPMDAVKHAMERDGLDSSVMDRDHSLPAQAMSCDDSEPKEKDSHRRARLHWKTLRKVTSNSLWAKIDQDDQLDKIEIDEAEFQELFQVEKVDETNTSQVTVSTKALVKRGVCVIDPKRANNGGIILARLKMSHDEMADAVDRINENALTAEQIEHIIEYLPTKEERKALEAYMLEGGQDAAEKFDRLCECEKFMVSMMTVKHAKRKVRALLFKLQFRTCLEDIYNDTVIIESACDELNNSVRLRQLFGIILTFGNRLNTVGSGKQRRAGAFTLDSLLKLKQAKAFDKKTTFLHYIVLIVRRNNEILLRFKDDLPSVVKADKIFWDQCVSDLEEVENQLENVRKISLHQARQSNAYRLRRKKRDDDAESLSEGDMDLSLEEEVELLRSTPIGLFTLSAIKYVSSLRDKVEVTKTKFARLLEYFGDEEKKLQPHELFSIIGTFSRDFEKANDEVVANEKRKQREERKRQAVSKAGPGRPPTYSPAPKQLKASNLQPTMFHVLTEMKAKVAARQAVPSSHPVHPQQLRRIEESPTHGSGQEQKSPPTVQRPARDDHESSNGRPNSEASPNRTEHLNRQAALAYQLTPSPTKPSRSLSPVITPLLQERQMDGPNNLVPSASSTNANVVNSSPEIRSPIQTKPTTVTPRAHNILREKAKLRRQRYIQERSPPPPTAAAPADQDMATPPLVRTRTPETTDDGAQPLSPRSSMRLRMEQRVLKNRAGTKR